MIGETISHYKIIEKLGGGGMGIVYKAQDLKLDRFVALKFLPPHLTTSAEEKQRFINEAKAASALQHNNICTIHEIDETEDGQLFICMDYYEGETLKKKVEHGQLLAVDEILEIAIQIANGLARAHESNIIHRDLKPANIMITNRGEVKIVDFGLAKLAGRSKLTKETTTLGTVAYMSPEQTEGSGVDNRTDIWSLGVVLYEMITGQVPFKGEYEKAVIYSIINEEPRQLTAIRSGISMELEGIVNKCLEKNPSNRYQHVDDLIVDLQKLKRDSESKITTSRKDVLLKESIGRKKLILLSLILLSIVIILVLGYFLINKFILEEKPEYESISALQWENSIAVLPFVDLSPEKDQEYFCDGMTEQIITNLSKLGKLKVIGRTSVMSYKNTDKKLPDIGKELKVSYILEGSIRKYGNSIRVTAQLINTDDGSHLWADDYDRELKNIFTIQDDISEKIAQVMLQKLSIEEIGEVKSKRPSNTEAYELYLRGRYFRIQQTDVSLQRALEYFKQAIAKDSTFAPAYAGLAKIYYLRRFAIVDAEYKLKKALAKALELDNTLPEAHMGLGDILESDWNWLGAEKAYKRAIELNPGNSEAHYEYGNLLYRTGRFKESINRMKHALELDPLSLLAHHGIALAYYYNRQFDKAIEYNLKSLELDENYTLAYRGLIRIYISKNEINKALEILKKLTGEWSYPFYATMVYAKWGKREESLILSDDVPEQLKGLAKARVYALFGEKDKAFFWIEKAIEKRELGLWFIKVDPLFDTLHSDPRYEEALSKIGLEP